MRLGLGFKIRPTIVRGSTVDTGEPRRLAGIDCICRGGVLDVVGAKSKVYRGEGGRDALILQCFFWWHGAGAARGKTEVAFLGQHEYGLLHADFGGTGCCFSARSTFYFVCAPMT